MITTSDFRPGLCIEWEGEVYQIVEFQHFKMAQREALVKTKLKNLKTKNVIQISFRSGEKMPKATLDEKKMQFLYKSDDKYYLMDTKNYEQISLSEEQMEKVSDFLQENQILNILYYQGEIIDVELPIFVELKVVETEPNVRGDTVSGGSKPAKLETGAEISVPLFIQEGDIIRIDTRSRKYVERVKGA